MLVESAFGSRHWACSDHPPAMVAEISQDHEQIPSCCCLTVPLVEPSAASTPIMGSILKDQLFDLAGIDLMLRDVRDVSIVPFQLMDLQVFLLYHTGLSWSSLLTYGCAGRTAEEIESTEGTEETRKALKRLFRAFCDFLQCFP